MPASFGSVSRNREVSGAFRVNPNSRKVLVEHVDVATPGGYFDVVAGTHRSQAATMVLEPGTAVGGPENRHPDSDQWLYVSEGSGSATVAGEKVELSAGDLLLIEAGEPHEIRANETHALVTLNVYAPPAY